MQRKLLLVKLLFLACCCLLTAGPVITQGAVVPWNEAEFVDLVQTVLQEPDLVASVLGLRQRRSAEKEYDKEYDIDILGMTVRIKYKDPLDHKKGAHVTITMASLNAIYPGYNTEQVELLVNIEGGETIHMNVEYELQHPESVESGVIRMTQMKNDENGDYKMTMNATVTSEPNPAVDLIPEFDLSVSTDKSTWLNAELSHGEESQYTLRANRVPGQSLDVVVVADGKTYTMDATYDKAEMAFAVKLTADGEEYTARLDYDETETEHQLTFTLSLGPSATYSALFLLDRDFTAASALILANNRELFNAKLKGKVESDQHLAKYELRYSGVGGLEGKLRLGLVTQPDQQLVLQYIPNSSPEASLKLSRTKTAVKETPEEVEKSLKSVHVQYKAIAVYGDQTLMEYTQDIVPGLTDTAFQLASDASMMVAEESVFSSYINNMTVSYRFWMDMNDKVKSTLDFSATMDSEPVATVTWDSRGAPPYKLVVDSPALLNNLTEGDLGVLEVEVDYTGDREQDDQQQQYSFKVSSNYPPLLESFQVVSIESVEGDSTEPAVKVVSLNGREVVRGTLVYEDGRLEQRAELPSGRQMNTTLAWDTSRSMGFNRLDFEHNCTDKNMAGYVDWDVREPTDMRIFATSAGDHDKLGRFEVSKNLTIACEGWNGFRMEWQGVTKMEQEPFPRVSQTDVSLDVDVEKRIFQGVVTKTVDDEVTTMRIGSDPFSLDE